MKHFRLMQIICSLVLLLFIFFLTTQATAEIVIKLMPGAKSPSFEYIEKDSKIQITAKENISRPLSIPLGSFDAQPQGLYSINADVSVEKHDVDISLTLTVDWFTTDGKNAGDVEKSLGFKDSTLKAQTPLDWNGYPIMLSVTGKASTADVGVRQGRVSLTLPKLKNGTVLTIKSIRVLSNPELITPKQGNDNADAVSFLQAEKGYNFNRNLVPNASFEDGKDMIVSGWSYVGEGFPHLSNDAYAGRRSLLLKSDNQQGRWESTAEEIKPNIPVWLCYWTKFSLYATPDGHPNPVRFEFLRQTVEDKQIPIAFKADWEFKYQNYYSFYGQWFPVIVGPIYPPSGATHIRALVQYCNAVKTWRPVMNIANWGDIMIDNVILWQSAIPEVSAEWRISPYGEMLMTAKSLMLPPFVTVGKLRDNSVSVFPSRNPDANLFFGEDGKVPTVKLRVGNLLPISRVLTVDGKVIDWNGKTISMFRQELKATPYGTIETPLPLSIPPEYGSYLIELSVHDGKSLCSESSVRFAWLPRRPQLADAERHHERYPFDMHPTRISADMSGLKDADEIDFQMRLMKLLGVRGIRLQSRYHGLDLNNPSTAVAAAQNKVAHWRKNVLPAMQKYGIEGWVSLMEQGSNNLPRIPRNNSEFQAWHSYNYAQVKAFGNDVKFFLFGNEGVGSYTTEDPDLNLNSVSKFNGTTREWAKIYQAAYQAAKSADPVIPFGLSHASDPSAMVAKRFFRIVGTEAAFDCWGFNAYGNTADMGCHIFQELQKQGKATAFGIIPEVGFSAPSFGRERTYGEKHQAIVMVQTYLSVLSQAPWIKRISWFILQGGRGSEEHNIFDMNWTPRPAAAAYLVMTDHLGAGMVEAKVELPGGGDFIIWRRIDGSAVGIGWSATEQVVSLDVGSETLFLDDIFGNRQKLQANDGIINIPLTPIPQYLIGTSKMEPCRRFELRAQNVTESKDGGSIVRLEISNNSKSDVDMTVTAQPHPLVRVIPSSIVMKALPGKTMTQDFKVSFLQSNNRRRSSIEFLASTASGMKFRIKMADTFAYCVRAPEKFCIDGTWQGWERAQSLNADQQNQVGQPIGGVPWNGPDDLSGKIMTMWDEQNLYVGLQVNDNVFFAQKPPNMMFLNDAVELGFELDHRLSGASQLRQFVLGKSTEGNTLFRHMPSPAMAIALSKNSLIIRPGEKSGEMIYQLALPWSALDGFIPRPGRQIGFGVIIDDSDAKPNDRKFISWFGGGISSKQPQELGDLIFVK